MTEIKKTTKKAATKKALHTTAKTEVKTRAAKKTGAKADASSLEASIYSQDGKAAGTITLPSEIFGLSWNSDLVHQVVTSMRTDARTPVAHTKDRGEVRGGGKKPWKQKGTGRARHGSSRSPIWVGGGVAHGPTNKKNFDRKINKKMKAKAVFTILSRKMRDGEVLFLKDLSLSAPKTSEARSILGKLSTAKGFDMLSKRRINTALITVPAADVNVSRGFSNMSNLEVAEIRNINPLALLQYKFVVITAPEKAIEFLSSKMN